MEAPFRYFIALDGPHLDGLIGCAGLLRFDWPERTVRVAYYDGVSAGHNVSLSPSGRLGILGNFSQQVVVVDTESMKEVARQSTFAIEPSAYRLRSNTHHLWDADEQSFIGVVGDSLYRFHLDDLSRPEPLGRHGLYNAHELRWDRDRRHILMGDLGPEDRAARRVGVFDLKTREARVIELPDTCWHVCVHPERPLGYAATYSYTAADGSYVDWSPAYKREYLFEFDLANARITRSWSAGAEFPVHLNSDLEVYGDALYIASGGSHSVVEIDVSPGALRTRRVLDCRPGFWSRARMARQMLFNLFGAAARRPTLTNTHNVAQTLEVTRGEMTDGIYAARVSPDGRYLVTGHRGYNVLTVYERETFRKVHEHALPLFGPRVLDRSYARSLRHVFGMHLGVHHSEMCARG